jgi:cytochrome b561
MLFFGEDMIEMEEMEEEGDSAWLPSLHASMGIAVLVLSLLRLALRAAYPPPPLPASMSEWQRKLSGATHALFYVLIIGLPITGMLAGTAMTEPPLAKDLSIFGLLSLAHIPLPTLPGVSTIHAIGGKIGIGLLALHVLAALYHQFWLRDGLLRRMT